MKQVTITLTGQEAEIVLFALSLREKQKGLCRENVQEAMSLRLRFNAAFTQAFGWCYYPSRWEPNGIKHVSVKLYDFPPQ